MAPQWTKPNKNVSMTHPVSFVLFAFSVFFFLKIALSCKNFFLEKILKYCKFNCFKCLIYSFNKQLFIVLSSFLERKIYIIFYKKNVTSTQAQFGDGLYRYTLFRLQNGYFFETRNLKFIGYISMY